MAKITIADLLRLQSVVKKEKYDVVHVAERGIFVEMNGEDKTDGATAEEFTEALLELDRMNALERDIADLLNKANRDTTFVHETYTGEQITLNLASGIQYAEQLRAKAKIFERLGNLKEKEVNSYGQAERIVVTRTHDIAQFAKDAKALFKEANRVSSEVDRQGLITMVEIEGADEYI